MSESPDISNIINTNTGKFIYRNNTITNAPAERRALARRIQKQAWDLCERLSNPDGFKFYCKVGWRLEVAKIQNNLEKALNAKHKKPGHTPAKFFSHLCKTDMGE